VSAETIAGNTFCQLNAMMCTARNKLAVISVSAEMCLEVYT